MDFSVNKIAADKQRASCIVVGIYESRRLSPSARALDDASGGELMKLIRSFEMQGSTDETLALNNLPDIPAKRVLLVGCGKKGAMSVSQYRRLLTTVMEKLGESGVKDVTLFLAELAVKEQDVYWKVRQIVETVRDSVYRFDQASGTSVAAKKACAMQ
jgi:leucyl aminopeptidase